MWVIAALAGLIGLFILVLCVPLDAKLSINTSEKPRFRLRLELFFGLIGKDLPREKKKPEAKREAAQEKRKKKRKIDFRTILKILRTRGLLKQIKNLVKGILGQFQIRELTVNLKLGLEDPADTGLVFALIGSTMSFLNLPPRYQISLQPSFDDEAVFEGYLSGVLRLQPVRLAVPLLRFIFSLTTLRVVKIFVVNR